MRSSVEDYIGDVEGYGEDVECYGEDAECYGEKRKKKQHKIGDGDVDDDGDGFGGRRWRRKLRLQEVVKALANPNRSLMLLDSLAPIQKPAPPPLQEASLMISSSLEHSTRATAKGSLSWDLPIIRLLFFLRLTVGDFDEAADGGSGRKRLSGTTCREEEESSLFIAVAVGICFLGIPGRCSQENGIPEEWIGVLGESSGEELGEEMDGEEANESTRMPPS
ncbi:hypothetical protein CRG98_017232 [Punica granatum]|uniref:Uncharacterized protein n=1 Tax=Punica granatum TaxID=22663 RepID=A0A2I0K3Z4_PUNGR|nr:hypothetical protein CRG98_017232 [Punica granatum]